MTRRALLALLLLGCGSAPDGGADAGPGGATQEFYRSGNRIKARFLVTPDGARSFVGWRDTERDEDCDFKLASDGKQRCLPSGATATGVFTDAACTVPLAWGGSCTSIPYVITTAGGWPCSSSKVFKAVPWSGATAYSGSAGGACIGFAYSLVAGYSYFIPGAEVSASDFQVATEALE